MVALNQLQSLFQDYLLHSDMTAVLPEIAPDERFSAINRLRVYHDSFRIRLHEILMLDYPKTQALMGEEEFRQAFILYLAKHPSHHFSVRYFGQHFKAFLENTAPYKDYPALAEMAEFEWSVSFTIDAKDAPIIKTEQLTCLPPEQWPDLRFRFHPSVKSVNFHWDIPQIWQSIDKEEPLRAPIQQETPTRWLFWRKGTRSYFHSCSVAENLLFLALEKGENFGEICESLMDVIPENEIPTLAAQTLFKWINEEMISEVYSLD